MPAVFGGSFDRPESLVQAWYISRITARGMSHTFPILTTHAHYIRKGVVGAR